MIVSILGCGWYGRSLATELLRNGFLVNGSATSPERAEHLRQAGIDAFVVKFDGDAQPYNPVFFTCDMIVVAIPPGFKKNQGNQYLTKIKRIIDAIKNHKIEKVIYISSTGVYADCNREVTEHDLPAPDSESGQVLFEAEQLFLNESRFKTTIIRFGGLVGPGRNPGRFFSGKTSLPNGLAPVNLIHQSDCVAITMSIIQKNCWGVVFNACAPDHPTKSSFYSQMARKSRLPAPVFLDKLNNWKIVTSLNLHSKLDYQFIVPLWNDYPAEELQ